MGLVEGRIKHDQKLDDETAETLQGVSHQSRRMFQSNISACAGPTNTEPQLNNDLNRFLRLPAAVLIAATLAGGGEDILVGRQQQI